MDNKRQLDNDESIPSSPLAQISKKSRAFKISQIVNKEMNFEDFFTDDDFELKENLLSGNLKAGNDLDLSKFKRCFVEQIIKDPKTQEVILTLKHETSEQKAECRLQVPWNYSRVAINQMVSVQGFWNQTEQCYVVSKDAGILVTFPDTLISGTSVVGSLFCSRKALLSTKFMGIDTNSKIMTIGTIVHEVLQVVLRKQLHTLPEIEKEVESLLNSATLIKMLYACEMSLADIRKELKLFIDKIFKFVSRYMKTGKSIKDDNYAGQIAEIQDIEENIWCPNLGMKGKIDVTVKDNMQNVLPLELKTGRASFSTEHRGQLIIYQMMLNQIGTKVDSGLLLYLREGIMKEIPATVHEQRDLIMLRNELAYYLTRTLPRPDPMDALAKNLETLELPDPINSGRICEKCPYNVICCTYLQKDKKIKLSADHPLNIISPAVLGHLKPEHVDYFIHWTGLLSMEEEEGKKDNLLKQIWTDTPEKRHKHGRALINLEISGAVIQPSGDEDRFTHVFTMQTTNHSQLTQRTRDRMDFTLSGIDVNEYMVVSTKDRISVASGFVCDITSRFVTMALERDLSKNYHGCTFHIDKYDSQSLMTFNFTNLGVLLDDSEAASKLRRIIIETQPPSSDKVLPRSILIDGAEILKSLNKPQQRAVLAALASKDYSLLKGLPGTGKTQTLVALIRLFLLLKKSILITSHTHSAVDNLLVRLMEHQVKFLRLGSQDRIKSCLTESSEKFLTANCKTPEELHQVYKQYDVVAVTCFGAAHPLVVQRKFDVCLVDEATQVMQCSVIRPLLSARTFVLVGDPNQLPPIIKSREAKALGADESLFARLQTVAAPKTLTHQYRMNKTINQLANQLTYSGELICANDDVAKSTIKVNQVLLNKQFTLEKWLLKSLSSHIDQSIILLDTNNVYDKSQMFGQSLTTERSGLDAFDCLLSEEGRKEKVSNRLIINYCEVAVTFYLINAMLMAGVKGTSIGIIAPYRAQVELLKKVQQRFEARNNDAESYKGIEVNTVDQYQGRDKDIIIYSCTKSDNLSSTTPQSIRENEILEDKRRLTVAITRAKQKLIIISDVTAVEKYTPFNEMFKKMSSVSKINLEEGRLGFGWESILTSLEDLLENSSNSTLCMDEI